MTNDDRSGKRCDTTTAFTPLVKESFGYPPTVISSKKLTIPTFIFFLYSVFLFQACACVAFQPRIHPSNGCLEKVGGWGSVGSASFSFFTRVAHFENGRNTRFFYATACFFLCSQYITRKPFSGR
jgi:hypothetical protein